MSSLIHVPIDGGTIAVEVTGTGPLVVCVPGMADLRSTYRHLVPELVASGHRVAAVDLRGHGDSSTAFTAFDDQANAADLIAIIEHLNEPAVVVGNSMGAAIGVLAAAERPDLVRGLVLIGPFVRNGKVNPVMAGLMRLLTLPAFVAATWGTYYPSLNAGAKPADFEQHASAIVAAIKKPGHRRAVSRTMRTSHDPAEAALPSVSTDVLVVMGERDPDFADPAAEAAWIAEQLDGDVLMVPDAGHYPHSQRPEVVGPAIKAFLREVDRG
jgi:pimeloyl-ACP methyl ester carboxylesterase